MNSTNYFAILLRQKANLVSLAEADRVAGAVPLALAGVFGDQQLQQILSLLPTAASKSASKQKFYHRIDKSKPSTPQTEFNLAILLARLKIILKLTGSDEAEQYLRAYFRAASALMHSSDTTRLLGLLPPQLVHIIYD